MKTFNPPKRPAETEYYGFDFSDALPEGVTITGVQWSIAVSRGTDPAVAAMLEGTPRIEGGISYHLVKGGVSGVRYVLRCLATLSDGQAIELSTPLVVKDTV